MKSSCLNAEVFHGSEMHGRVGIFALYKLRDYVLGAEVSWLKLLCFDCSAIMYKISSTINYTIKTNV